MEWRDGKFQKTSQNARHVTPASIPESSMLCSPLSTFPKAIHPTPVKDKQSPEALLSHLIKGKESQSERKLKNWMAERGDRRSTAGLGLSVDGASGSHNPEVPQYKRPQWEEGGWSLRANAVGTHTHSNPVRVPGVRLRLGR